MRLVWLWCALAGAAAADGRYYAPQTFRQAPRAMFQPAEHAPDTSALADERYAPLFRPAADAAPQATIAPSSWSADAEPAYRDGEERRADAWRPPPGKEQRAHILHHKQSLSSEGEFRFEYAADSGLAAGEAIAADGSRVGGYQYRDPSGRLVRLKYRAGRDGFQVLEGSHLPQSPEPVPPAPQTEEYYSTAYEQQRRQYQLQQQHDRQPAPHQQHQESASAARPYGGAWPTDAGDDGQYRDNSVEQSRGPHSFGAGYAFAFKG